MSNFRGSLHSGGFFNRKKLMKGMNAGTGLLFPAVRIRLVTSGALNRWDGCTPQLRAAVILRWLLRGPIAIAVRLPQ